MYAPSGAGKSSLLNTIVQEGLEANDLEVLAGVRVGAALPDKVAAAAVRNVFTYSAVGGIELPCECLAISA